MKMKKILSLLLSLLMICVFPVTAFASGNSISISDKENLSNALPELTVAQKREMDNWVAYDNTTRQFYIKDGAREKLGKGNYELLSRYLMVTNSSLLKADLNGGEIEVLTPSQDAEGRDAPSVFARSRRRFSEGVTKIVFHWWGATIYLSKTTINFLGGGVAVGGIWILEPVVSKILSTLGVAGTLCPGGIAFDYNYVAAGIGTLAPGMSIFFPAVRNIRWQ